MSIILTPAVLGHLIRHGYKYCLAKFEMNDNFLSVTLLPTKRKPVLSFLQKEYDRYYAITEEPFQMALGIGQADSKVFIKMNEQELETYKSNLQLC